VEEAVKKAPADLQSSASLARLKLSKNDVAGAEAVMKQAVANAPKSPMAFLMLGRFYVGISKLEQAEAAFRRGIEMDPQSAQALYSLGMVQVRAQRNDEAEQTFKQLAALPDKNFKPIYGMFLFDRGKQDAAMAEFRRLYQEDPKGRLARTRLIAAYIAMNKFPEADNLLTRALAQNGRDTEALLQRSELRLRSGDSTSVESDMNQVLKIQPDSSDAHFALARAMRLRGNGHGERQHLTEVLRLNPSHLSARIALARNLITAKDAKGALDVLDHAPPGQRSDLSVTSTRNLALIAAGDIKEARAGVNAGLSKGRTPELVLEDGLMKADRGDFLAARVSAEELLKRNPEDVWAVRLLVSTYTARQEWTQALQRMRQLAAERPNSAVLQYMIGSVLVGSGDVPNGRRAYEAAIALSPAFAAPRLALAALDIVGDHTETARQNLKAVLAAQPGRVDALLMVAQLEVKAGNQPEAIAYYRKVLAVEPSNTLAMNNLAYFEATDNPNEALGLAEHALELAPNSAMIMDTLGWIHYQKGRYTKAVDLLKRAVEKEPTARHQFHLAVSYLKAGERDLGQKMMALALQKDPNLPKTEQGW
jgi:tetratricopeptide (TPR) repeat protein